MAGKKGNSKANQDCALRIRGRTRYARFMGYGGVEGAGRLWFYEPSSRELFKGADLFQSTLLTPNAGKTFRMNA